LSTARPCTDLPITLKRDFERFLSSAFRPPPIISIADWTTSRSNFKLEQSFEELPDTLPQKRRISSLIMTLLWKCYLLIYWCLTCYVLLAETATQDKSDSDDDLRRALLPLNKVCIENSNQQIIPFYLLCFYRSIFQINYDFKSNAVTETNVLGHFKAEESRGATQVYYSPDRNCQNEDGSSNSTTVMVKIECCTEKNAEKEGTVLPKYRSSITASSSTAKATIQSVNQIDSCLYQVQVCSDLICSDKRVQMSNLEQTQSKSKKEGPYEISKQDQLDLKTRSKEMFYHAYRSYMDNAFPMVILFLFFNLSFLLLTHFLGRTETSELRRRAI
jgi:hypothetical protein